MSGPFFIHGRPLPSHYVTYPHHLTHPRFVCPVTNCSMVLFGITMSSVGYLSDRVFTISKIRLIRWILRIKLIRSDKCRTNLKVWTSNVRYFISITVIILFDCERRIQELTSKAEKILINCFVKIKHHLRFNITNICKTMGSILKALV